MDHMTILKSAEEIERMLRDGYDKKTIAKKMKDFSEQAFSIAKAKIKNARENKIDNSFLFDEEDLRYCTNQQIAEYRAERLKCDTIVDIGSGIGVQAIEFAKKCSKVIAVEIDERKIEYSRINAKIAGVENIEFVNEDAIKALDKIKIADIVFWDPERPETEKERGIASLKPSFSELIKKARKITPNIAVELPPQIEKSKMKEDCEFEYVSLNNQLNRLNVYLGKLKKCRISVVSLPSKERLEYKNEKIANLIKEKEVKTYLYEVDDAIIKSGLVEYFTSGLNASILQTSNKTYLTSDEAINSSFLKRYKVITQVEHRKMKEALNKNGFGKVILHGRIDDTRYATIRKNLETGLRGKETAHLFLNEDNAVITISENKP